MYTLGARVRLLWLELTSTCVGHTQETYVAIELIFREKGKAWGSKEVSLFLFGPLPQGWS